MIPDALRKRIYEAFMQEDWIAYGQACGEAREFLEAQAAADTKARLARPGHASASPIRNARRKSKGDS